MKCERCDSPAKIRLVEVINDKKVVRNLCEACAAGQQALEPTIHVSPDAPEIRRTITDNSPRCPGCEITFQQFRRQGRLGCPDCYVAFRVQLGGLLDRIHGRTQHTGKRPNQLRPELSAARQLLDLRDQLARAVTSESYEEAARLRDQIRALAPTPERHGAQ